MILKDNCFQNNTVVLASVIQYAMDVPPVSSGNFMAAGSGLTCDYLAWYSTFDPDGQVIGIPKCIAAESNVCRLDTKEFTGDVLNATTGASVAVSGATTAPAFVTLAPAAKFNATIASAPSTTIAPVFTVTTTVAPIIQSPSTTKPVSTSTNSVSNSTIASAPSTTIAPAAQSSAIAPVSAVTTTIPPIMQSPPTTTPTSTSMTSISEVDAAFADAIDQALNWGPPTTIAPAAYPVTPSVILTPTMLKNTTINGVAVPAANNPPITLSPVTGSLLPTSSSSLRGTIVSLIASTLLLLTM